ncbi:hypothetical protein ACSBR2_030606 [Camellia fascicularis]
MKVLSWNVRGLGKPEKRRHLKNLIKEKRVDMVLIQETKKSSFDEIFVRSIWPEDDLGYIGVDAVGSAGGLLCLWKPAVFQSKDCCGSRNFILLSGLVYHRLDCVTGNVYAPNDSRGRSHLWLVLANLKASFPKPWCLGGGDFNEIKNIGERKGCARCDRGMQEFNEFSNNLELVDVPMCERKYTWSNSQLGGLPRSVSDHCPILLKEDERNWGPKPFRFLNAWVLHPNFIKEVEKVWMGSQVVGWAGFRIMTKLRSLKQALRIWNVEVFGHVESKLKAAEAELHSWDLIAKERDLLEAEVRKRIEIKDEVWKLRKRREWIWLQKSRLNWVLKGDKNTRFFHIMASRRQSRNLIDSLKINGIFYEDPVEMKKAVWVHFKELFTEGWKIRPSLGGEFKCIDQVGVANVEVEEFATKLNCSSQKLPLKYLGLPLGASPSRRLTWRPVVEKFRKKLSGWKRRMLSFAGRVTLIKSVLSALPIYYMSLFKMPEGVAKEIDRIESSFLWGDSEHSRKLHLVGWSKVCMSMKQGGLGIKNIRLANESLLFKSWWRYGLEDDALWKSIICEKYGSIGGRWFPVLDTNGSTSKLWVDILSVAQSNSRFS